MGFGQVVALYGNHELFFAIFDKAYPRTAEPLLSDVVADRIAFLSLSLDAKLYVGHWVVLGNQPVREDVPLPAFKEAVGTPDRIDVVDYAGKQRRRASSDEAEILPYRTTVAPVR